MMNYRISLFAVCLILLAVLLPASLCLAQAEKRTQNTDITADVGTFNWSTNVFEFKGNAHAVLSGTYEATVNAPSMTFQLTSKGSQVSGLTTTGPAHFEVLLPPDTTGKRHKVLALAPGGLRYSEVESRVVLLGNASGLAEANIVALDAQGRPEQGPEAQQAYFSGDEMTADLANNTLTVTKAHMKATSPLKEAGTSGQ